jgi:hypothetical protein
MHLAYVKWDDRRSYVLRSDDLPGVPLAAFSSRTLCLHDLRGRAGAAPALVRVPLYWYPTNVQTRGHCVNELERLRLTANGPDRVALRITSVDPNRRARSTFTADIRRTASAVTVATRARLKVLSRLDLPALQYLNAFPAGSWQPEDWPDDWVVLATSDGREACEHFKEPRDRRRQWDDIRRWTGRLAFVQGAAGRGNIFILAESRKPADQPNGYMLCPVWLDSHFTMEALPAPLEKGTELEAAYQIGVLGDAGLCRAEALTLAREALTAGRLPLG